MPYYRRVNLLFIHIPKTGGTVIEDEIKKKFSQELFSNYTNKLLEYPYSKISLQHQFYSTIYNYKKKIRLNLKNLKTFAVIRNPYDRIISDLFWYNLIKSSDTPEIVYNVIKNNYIDRDDLDNHNVPQYKFVTDKNSNLVSSIKIFRCETLNEDNDLLCKFLGFKINIKRNNVNKNYDKYLNKMSIDLINNFYKKDFELFNYEMK